LVPLSSVVPVGAARPARCFSDSAVESPTRSGNLCWWLPHHTMGIDLRRPRVPALLAHVRPGSDARECPASWPGALRAGSGTGRTIGDITATARTSGRGGLGDGMERSVECPGCLCDGDGQRLAGVDGRCWPAWGRRQRYPRCSVAVIWSCCDSGASTPRSSRSFHTAYASARACQPSQAPRPEDRTPSPSMTASASGIAE
jgi:hypothetical protein